MVPTTLPSDDSPHDTLWKVSTTLPSVEIVCENLCLEPPTPQSDDIVLETE